MSTQTQSAEPQTDGVMPEAAPNAVGRELPPSRFITLSNGSRTLAENIGTVSINGTKVFVNDRSGNLLVVINLRSEADAEDELLSINDQIDSWDAARLSRAPAGRPMASGATHRR
jgi:hypothetical protein